MADVTINQLPDLTITGTSFLAHTNAITTGRATVNELRSALNIPPAQVQSNWTQSNSSAVDFILNKPNTIEKVLFYTKTDTTAISNSVTSINLGGPITLSKASNRVYITANVNVAVGTAYQSTRDATIYLRRNGVRVGGMGENQFNLYIGAQGSATYWGSYCTFSFLDIPGSVGPHTYDVVMRERSASGGNWSFSAAPNSYLTLMEINN